MLTILSDLERRIIANLSIPRNVEDLTHQIRIDQYIKTESEENIYEKLLQLEHEGWVINIGNGQHQPPGELASIVDINKNALSMPDEKALLFESRLSLPGRKWRLKGDVWIITTDGMEKLHEPITPDNPSNKETIERLIKLLQKTVLDVPFEGSIFDPDGGKLGKDISLTSGKYIDGTHVATLLPEEFTYWTEQVLEEFQERTGEKITPPLMGGAGYSDAWENLGIDAENGKATGFQLTPPWYMALTTVAVTDADTGSTITEPTYTGYARKSVAAADMNTAASGSSSNANAITFAPCTAGTSTVIGFAKCISSSAGVMQKYGTTASTTISATQTPATFAVAAFTTSLD